MTHHSRREFLGQLAATTVAATLSQTALAQPAPQATPQGQPAPTSGKKRNVLFLMSDDMRVELGCYGSMFNALTPNLDALAKSGVRFDRNYCQYPLCNPSRVSLLTGRPATKTGVIGNRTDFRKAHPEWTTLPALFSKNGYVTVRAGKIFHGGIDDAKSWNAASDPDPLPEATANLNVGKTMPVPRAQIPTPEGVLPPLPADTQQSGYSDRIVVLDGNGEDHGDYRTADHTIANLRKYRDKPFFIACGFVKPHSPPTAPQRFLDWYDPEKIKLTPDFAPWPTVPPGFPSAAIRKRNADLFIGRGASESEAKQVIRAYLASISWCDWNVGRVIAELDALGLRDNTIIVFMVDHGYQLGEKGKWSKAGSLFEMGTRVPLLIRAPDAAGNGRACVRTVQSMDVYATLAELCGLPLPAENESVSFTKLLDHPDGAWDRPAYSIWSEDGETIHGVAVRTAEYRYAEFGHEGENGAMLFDVKADPLEMHNLATDPKYAKVSGELAQLARKYAADMSAA